MGNTPDARALRDSNGLKLVAAELSFMCREILGIGFEPKQLSADPEKRDEWMALQTMRK
jgi:hypothetical protein